MESQQVEVALSPEAGKPHVKTMLLLGQGPVKPVLKPEELTTEQRTQWEIFKKSPLHQAEPEFRVLDESFTKIPEPEEEWWYTTSVQDRANFKAGWERSAKLEWQETPRFALNKYGRVIALAGGTALMNGLTEKLVICGGKTIPKWAKADGANPLPAETLEHWPTEASLMKKLVITRFGDLYEKQFGKPIEEAIVVEEGSTTSIYNIANAVEDNPQLFGETDNISLLTADFHLDRVVALTEMMLEEVPGSKAVYPAETILQERYSGKVKMGSRIMQEITSSANPEVAKRLTKEGRLIKELTDPRVYGLWSLTGKVMAELHDDVIRFLKPDWIAAAAPLFTEAGLDINKFTAADLENLKGQEHNKYVILKEGLLKLNLDSRFATGWKPRGDLQAKTN